VISARAMPAMVWKYRPRGRRAELHRLCPVVVDRVTSRAILCVVLDLPQLIYGECRSLHVVCRAEWDQAFGSMMMFDTPLLGDPRRRRGESAAGLTVGAAGLEPTTSWSQTRRATVCAAPRGIRAARWLAPKVWGANSSSEDALDHLPAIVNSGLK
jgi:hypothetical protein